MSQKACVHTEHCCALHGCKYGDDDCPVWLGYKSQSFGFFDGEITHSIPEVSEEVFERRRLEEEIKNPIFEDD